MKTLKKPNISVYIINPKNNRRVKIEKWLQQNKEIRTKAEWICFIDSAGYKFLMHKSSLPENQWEKQQITIKNLYSNGRLGTRYEYSLIKLAEHYLLYNKAIRDIIRKNRFEIHIGFNTIDNILKLIGGDCFNGHGFWTEENTSENYKYAISGMDIKTISIIHFSELNARIFKTL